MRGGRYGGQLAFREPSPLLCIFFLDFLILWFVKSIFGLSVWLLGRGGEYGPTRCRKKGP